MLSWLRRYARAEQGASLIETALMSVLLLLLLAGSIDFGRMYYSYVVITNAAREGARTAARLPCTSDTTQRAQLRSLIVQAVQNETANLPKSPAGTVYITITPDPASTCFAAGGNVTVVVGYDFKYNLSPFLGSTGFKMQSATTMVAFGNDQLPPG